VWVNWRNSRDNMAKLKGITIDEKEFAWRLTQDMLKIGARKHWGDPLRRKECRVRWKNERGENQRCKQFEDRRHVFVECTYSRNKMFRIKETIKTMAGKEMSTKSIIHLDFKVPDEKIN